MATYKDNVRVATTGNITLSGTQTIDNISLAVGNRVLVKDQTTAAENGIYAVASGGWSRDRDANASELMSPETMVRVSEGAVNAHTEWSLSTQAPIRLGETALTFVKTSFDGQTTKAMADSDQTLTLAEAACVRIKTTGALTATRTLTFPAPSSDGASYERLIHNACTEATITVTTGTGQTFALDPGAKADLQFTTAGVLPIADYVLDPRDFGCPWNGVDDDLPGLQAMINKIPASRKRVTRIQLPKAAGYCSGNWEIYKPVEIVGHGRSLTSEGSHIKFAPLRGIIFHGAYSSPNTPDSSADHSTLRDVNVISTRAIVSDDLGNWGLVDGYQLGTITATWDRLPAPPANVQLGSCALRGRVASPATVDSSNQEYYGDGHTRNTTHLVMFRCTTAGTKGSSVPADFATRGLAQLGTQITATNGTAVWTVESIPKDYANDTSYVAGQRVFVPGDNDHVFECVEAGTSIELASTTIAALSDNIKLVPPTINVADTSDFPSTGVICVVTSNGREFVYYTGKTETLFTGCDIVRELKAASGVMSTGGAVTGPFPYAKVSTAVNARRRTSKSVRTSASLRALSRARTALVRPS
jgi:hypothetical protein